MKEIWKLMFPHLNLRLKQNKPKLVHYNLSSLILQLYPWKEFQNWPEFLLSDENFVQPGFETISHPGD